MVNKSDLELVRAAFGEAEVVDKERLVKVLATVAPSQLTDETARRLVQAADEGAGSEVRVDDFLRWLFAEGAEGAQGAATEVFFCRHGETDWNLSHKLQGLTDIPLNDAGREQAGCIAEALGPKSLAAVWTSPLLRARDTAAAIAQAVGVELKVDERLRERNLGVMEGRTGKEIEAEFPEVWEAWKALKELPPEGKAEPEPEVVARVEAALFDLAAAHPGRSVAVVAHGAVLRALCRKTFGNASISTLQVGPGRSWKAVHLDDGSHLKTPGLKV